MQRRRLITTLALLGAANISLADNSINTLQNVAQANFKLLSEDLSSTLSYKAVIPATPLGITGFDLGVEASGTKLQHPEVWQQATNSTSAPSTIVVPKIYLHKGLPLDFDVGAFYTSVPTSNIKLVGFEVRYALVTGGVATPAVGLRGTYTKLSGVDQLALNTMGIELLVSKGFAFVTPYLGVGHIKTNSDPQGIPTLQNETINQNKTFAGINMNFGLVNLALEGDKTGGAASYSLKFGFRF
ncbi:MAG TPA: hypothetical protein VK138_11785 [Acidiferrobacterales bacterium]|nr:hypothetical protein [Acidiferrobacterales bacterium]